MLDAWLRDVCSTYGSLRDRERQAVREFLKLDMSDPVCIEIQDRMVRGLVEANRGVAGGNINPSAFLGQQVEDIMHETPFEAAAIAASKVDSASPGSAKSPVRRSSVKVTEGSTTSQENQFLKTRSASVRVPEQERLDVIRGSLLSNKINTETSLPNRAIRRASSYQVGSTSTTDSSPLSPTSASSPSGNAPSQRKKRSYVVTVPDSNLHIMMPKRELSTINDEDAADIISASSKGPRAQEVSKLPAFAVGEGSTRSRSDSNSSNLEEKLLHIGSKRNAGSTSKQGGCCCVS
jgi:hypothetical protein